MPGGKSELVEARCFIKAERIYVHGDFLANSVLVVEGDTILEVVSQEKLRSERVDDWGNVALIPGTINAHNHSFQSLLKGIGDDFTFLDWRDKVLYPFAKKLDREAIYAGALMAFGEMLRSGITTVCDFFYINDQGNENAKEVIRAAEDLGIRLVLARCFYDWKGAPRRFIESVDQAVSHTRALMDEYHGNPSHPLVSVIPAPHSPHGASREMIRAGSELAQERGVPFHIHVAEGRYEVEQIREKYHLSPTEYLDSCGVLNPALVMIHGVWLDEGDIARMKKSGASLVYNPSSNMFLGDGVTNIPLMRREGITIALGTDGGCTNNRLSIFEEMRMTGLLQKVTHLDGSICGAGETFSMGTSAGGRVLRLSIGALVAGMKADLVALKLGDLSLQPPSENLIEHIVYSMHPSAIDRVMVGGRVVMKDGELQSVALREIVDRVGRVTSRW